MLEVGIKPYSLEFIRPSGTSRGILTHKNGWFITIQESDTGRLGIGECSIIEGLSPDNLLELNEKLIEIKDSEGITNLEPSRFPELPSLRFALEMAHQDLNTDQPGILFPSDFTSGHNSIDINGLIWMGKKEFMLDQIKEKIQKRFRCLKLKIGAIDFETECMLLKYIRAEYSQDDIMLRVDANGAFDPRFAMDSLKRLSEFDLHSIEQPIKAGQIEDMAALCEKTPLAIALDEELIGQTTYAEKMKLLNQIKPQYIILKPSLLGGFSSSEEWITLAEDNNIDWWVTSALESNIGLNAISQWTATLDKDGFQGLGTGQLYTNNIPSPLYLDGDRLFFDPEGHWNLMSIINPHETIS
jgi:o-succinylbenzoate synthase